MCWNAHKAHCPFSPTWALTSELFLWYFAALPKTLQKQERCWNMPDKNRITSNAPRGGWGWAGTEKSHCLIMKSIHQAGEGVRTLRKIHPNSSAAIRELLRGLGRGNKMGITAGSGGKVHLGSPILSPNGASHCRVARKDQERPQEREYSKNLDGSQPVPRRKAVEAELCVGFQGRRNSSMKFPLPSYGGWVFPSKEIKMMGFSSSNHWSPWLIPKASQASWCAVSFAFLGWFWKPICWAKWLHGNLSFHQRPEMNF